MNICMEETEQPFSLFDSVALKKTAVFRSAFLSKSSAKHQISKFTQLPRETALYFKVTHSQNGRRRTLNTIQINIKIRRTQMQQF